MGRLIAMAVTALLLGACGSSAPPQPPQPIIMYPQSDQFVWLHRRTPYSNYWKYGWLATPCVGHLEAGCGESEPTPHQ
jgi:hypothetical protein